MLITKYWHAYTSLPSFFYFGSQHRKYNQIQFYICEPEQTLSEKIPLFFKIITSNGALLNLDLEVIEKVERNDKTFWPQFRFIWTETKKWNTAPNLKDCRKHSLGGTLTYSASGTFNWSASCNRATRVYFCCWKSDKITRKPLTQNIPYVELKQRNVWHVKKRLCLYESLKEIMGHQELSSGTLGHWFCSYSLAIVDRQ